MFFWLFFFTTLFLILYSYYTHFFKSGFNSIKKTFTKNASKIRNKSNCIFKGFFFFQMDIYDIYDFTDYIVLIRYYNFHNNFVQSFFPENYIIIINEKNIDKNLKNKFLNCIIATNVENTNEHTKITGSLYTKLVFSNDLKYEREISLTIQ